MKTKIVYLVMALALVFGLLAVMATPAGAQTTRHVYPGAGTPIQDAVDAANPGDTIIIHQGTYTENVVVDIDLVIQGAAGEAMPYVAAATSADATFHIYGDYNVTLKGLEITSGEHGVQVGNDTDDVIGTIYILDNKIHHNGEADGSDGIVVADVEAGASVTIQGNEVYSNWDDGIDIDVIYGTVLIGGPGAGQGNLIYDNDSDGIEMDDEIYGPVGSLTIQGNTIGELVLEDGLGNGDYGINLEELYGGSLFVLDNVINGNEDIGVYFDNDYYGAATLSGNTIKENGDDGMYMYDLNAGYDYGWSGGSVFVIEDNTISDNSGDGIYFAGEIVDGSMLTIGGLSNTITGNDGYGIYFEDAIAGGAVVDILDNDIDDNEYGIYFSSDPSVDEGSTVTIAGNSISDNDYDGIYFSGDIEESTVSIGGVSNDISRNGGYGIYFYYYIEEGSTVDILDNTITDNWDEGIYFNDDIDSGATVNIKNNTITGNSISEVDTGIYVYDVYQSTLTIQGNNISGNYGDGIYLDYADWASATYILDNTINSNIWGSGIYIYEVYDDCNVFIQGNTINDNDYEGIYIESIAYGVVTIGGPNPEDGNTISGNGEDTGIYIDAIGYSDDEGSPTYEGSCIIEGNTITDNDGSGIEVWETYGSMGDVWYGATLAIKYNEITGHGSPELMEDRAGIVFYDVSGAVIRGNDISNNAYGIVLLGGFSSDYNLITENTIDSNGLGMYVMGSYNLITYNAITNNTAPSEMTGVHLTCAADDNVINWNNIAGNGVGEGSYGVYQEICLSPTTDARFNYWGDVSGPENGPPGGSGDAIYGDVLYSPWLGLPMATEAGVNGVSRPSPMHLYVDGSTGTTSPGDIQNAIDAALPGDTIYALPETYYEIILVETPQLTILSTEGAEVTTIDGDSITVTITADDVVFGAAGQGFTVVYSTDSGIDVYYAGLDEGVVVGVVIEGNIVRNNSGDGIQLRDAQNCTVRGNEVYDNYDDGIDLNDSDGNTLAGNEVYHNGDDGIDMDNAHSNTIGGPDPEDANIIYENGEASAGIDLDRCNDNTIEGNEIFHHDVGIELTESFNNTVGGEGNTIYLCQYGILLEIASTGNEVLDNTVYWCDYGIYLQYGPHNNTISGNTVYQCGSGIYLYGAPYNTISANTIYGCTEDTGIHLVVSDYNIIGGDTDEDGNEVYSNDKGIYLDSSSHNTISHNNVHDNLYRGIELGCGVSNWNVVSHNEIVNNSEGVYINGDYNSITWNNIVANIGAPAGFTGVYLTQYAEDNQIHCNNIVNNITGVYKECFEEDAQAWLNWWGHASGPSFPGPGSGSGDAVSACVNYEPWLDAPMNEATIPGPSVTAYAVPDMIAMFGEPNPMYAELFYSEGEIPGWAGAPFSPGPGNTTLVVDAPGVKDEPGNVVIDLRSALYQLLPTTDAIIAEAIGKWPEGEQDNMWHMWHMALEELASTPLYYDGECGVWMYDFCSTDIFGLFQEFTPGEEHFWGQIFPKVLLQMQLGHISIPVTAIGFCGPVTSTIDLSVVDFTIPLQSDQWNRWNLRSTPMVLEDCDGKDEWSYIAALGDGLNYDLALRYDPTSPFAWVDLAMEPDFELQPLESIYIRATEPEQMGLIIERSRDPMPGPVRDLDEGWNLIALSPSFSYPNYIWWPVDEALVSLADPYGPASYSVVISPMQLVEFWEAYVYSETCVNPEGYFKYFYQAPDWIYTVGSTQVPKPPNPQPFLPKWMSIGGGQWVYMENADTLVGFFTPSTFWTFPWMYGGP